MSSNLIDKIELKYDSTIITKLYYCKGSTINIILQNKEKTTSYVLKYYYLNLLLKSGSKEIIPKKVTLTYNFKIYSLNFGEKIFANVPQIIKFEDNEFQTITENKSQLFLDGQKISAPLLPCHFKHPIELHFEFHEEDIKESIIDFEYSIYEDITDGFGFKTRCCEWKF